MRVRRDVAVAICKDYGFKMADGWSDLKLAKKVGDLVELFRSGEFEPEDEALAEELSRLAEVRDDGEIEVVVSDEPESDREDVSRNRKEAAKEPVAIEEVDLSDDAGVSVQEDVDREQDSVELEIARLKKRIQELKQMKKNKKATDKKRPLRRDEIAAMVLKRHPEGGSIPRLAEEVESEYVEQGRKPGIKKSVVAVRRVAQVGVLLGIMEVEDREVRWKYSN